jgi:hypothetical protein
VHLMGVYLMGVHLTGVHLINVHLQVKATEKIQAIVEVKRKLREGNKPNLEMQEAAEMVGWIMDNEHRPDPSLVGR